MAEIMAVVPEEGMDNTGLISYKFLIDADAPPRRIRATIWDIKLIAMQA